MTRWMTCKLIAVALATIWLGVMMLALGIEEGNLHPYQPNPNMVTPQTYGYPSNK